MNKKNKRKIRLTESQLQKLILKEFVPNAVRYPKRGGAGVRTPRRRRYKDPGQPKGDVEIVWFDSVQKLDFTFETSPSILDRAKAEAERFVSNYWETIKNELIELAFLGDEDEGDSVFSPIDMAWNWTLSWVMNRGQSVSDGISQFNTNRSANRIAQLAKFDSIDIVGSYGGRLLIELRDLDDLCDFACALLSEPIEREVLDDLIKIINLLAGERRTMQLALGRGTKLGKIWSDMKNAYGKEVIDAFNASDFPFGKKVQTGEADFENPGPCYAVGKNQIFNALEYFKARVFRISPGYWSQYEIKREIVYKDVKEDPDAWIFKGSVVGKTIDQEASTMTLKRIPSSNETIPSRLRTLNRYYSQESNEAMNSLNTLRGKIKANTPAGKKVLATIDEMNKIFIEAENMGQDIDNTLNAMANVGMISNPQGSARAVQSSAQFNESIKRKSENLLIEQGGTSPAPAPATPTTTNYQNNFRQYVQELAASQDSPMTGLPSQDYTLQKEDEGALWLGPDVDAAAFKVGKLSDRPPWGSVAFRDIAAKITTYMFSEEGEKRTGASYNTSTGEVFLPNEDSFAFYIIQMTEETGDPEPRYINALEINELADAIAADLQQRFDPKKYPTVTKLALGASAPKEEEKKEDKKDDRCPKDKLKLDTASLSKIGKSGRVKLLQKGINKYLAHHQLPGGPIGVDGDWGSQTTDGFERVVYHALMEDDNPAIGLNHPVWGGQFNGQVANKIAQNWKSRADDLNLPGYVDRKKEGDVTGAVAIVYDAYNCNTEYGKQDIKRPSGSGGKGTSRKVGAVKDTEGSEGKCADGSAMKKATWRDIQIQFNQKSKKFSLDKRAVDQLKIDLAKQTAAFIVNPPHSMNPVTKEHVGTFTIGVGGRIKNRKSHDWNVPDAYEKIIDKAMKNLIQKAKKGSKGLDVVRNSNIIITIPCGNYTTLAESIRQKREKDFENLLRELIKKV